MWILPLLLLSYNYHNYKYKNNGFLAKKWQSMIAIYSKTSYLDI